MNPEPEPAPITTHDAAVLHDHAEAVLAVVPPGASMHVDDIGEALTATMPGEKCAEAIGYLLRTGHLKDAGSGRVERA